MSETIINTFSQLKNDIDKNLARSSFIDSISQSADTLVSSLKEGGHIYSCGNGGSMADAIHFAEELSGRFRDTQRGFPAVAISDSGHLSCVANDFGYDHVFSRYVEAFGRKGDVFLGISTSGQSANVIKGAQTAKSLGMNVIGLTGGDGGAFLKECDVAVCCDGSSGYADRIQEIHGVVIHILIQMIEEALCPK